MTSSHRLLAIIVVWGAFAWTSFFMFGLSVSLFMPTLVVVTLSIILVVAALLATYLILGLGAHDS